jgi:hypothetical protein
MIARFTALILSLSIGLPMCWCCVGAPQQEETASCCSMKRHAASEQLPDHSKEPNCPCARHQNRRDVASTFVKAPVPALKLLAAPVWFAASVASLPPSVFAPHTPRYDHGPPLRAAPLYARHCALLI